MARYKHVLAAVDLTDDSPQVLRKARLVASEQGATLSVVTTIRPLNYAYAGMETGGLADVAARFEPEARAYATARLAELGSEYEFPAENAHVMFGKPSVEINDLAEAVGADLVVIGTHARRALGRLLGSTANALLHGAKQDVIAVKIVDPA